MNVLNFVQAFFGDSAHWHGYDGIPSRFLEHVQYTLLALAVGPGAFDSDGKRIAMDVKVGQKVLYGKYAGTEFKLDDEDLLIVSQKDILAVVGD